MWEKANKDHVYVAKENISFLSFHLLSSFIHSLMWESVHRDVNFGHVFTEYKQDQEALGQKLWKEQIWEQC